MKPRWIFTSEEFKQRPSIRCGMSEQEELNLRQQTAGIIRSIGTGLTQNSQRPSMKTIAVNTAMVFMHRFYMHHSFQKYPPKSTAPALLFLAAKVEETPVRLAYIIKTFWMVTNPRKKGDKDDRKPPNDWQERASRELIANENLILQTIGFDVVVEHSQPAVVEGTEIFKLNRKIGQLAYDLARESLHFTTLCLKYKPTTIAATCFNIAQKGANMDLGKSIENKDWWLYIDPELDAGTLKMVTDEFLDQIAKNRHQFHKHIPYLKEFHKQGSTTSTQAS